MILFKTLFIFIERGREGERDQCERKKLVGCFLYAQQLQTKPATQASALTGNQTNDLLLCGTMPKLSHTGQGEMHDSLKTVLHLF